MRRLRSSILNVALIGLLLAVCISAQAGVVSLTVTSEGVGPGSSSNVVFRGCAVKFTYIASDCDEHDSDCCWDDLTFPVWPEECPLPTKVNDTIYMGECTITCDWTGPKDFVFKADDQVHCTNQENDDLATQTITITGVAVDSIVAQNAPWIGVPNAPVCPCQEEGTVVLTAVTDPVGYEYLISWSGGGVPETGTGAFFQTYWTTPGTKTVRAGCGDDAQTMDIEVAEPFYDASFLDLTGPVGGTTAVKYQVRTRCVAHGMPGLETRHTANDPWTDDDVIALGERCTTNLPDENGITSYMYPLLLWQTIDRVTDGNGVEHNLDKVDWYLLRGTTDMTPCTSQQTVTDTQTDQVGVHNLTLESTLPEGVVFWTGEEETTIPIQVTIEDNDLSDPVTLTLRLYNTGDDNRGAVWSPSATLQHDGITSEAHTFYWNGTPTGESYDTNYLPAGTYTFEVTATQTDENLCLNCNGIPPEPGCTAGDEETYRSEYLKIVRASDESGNPIYDVEYDGYDDNGTPNDESDDKYIYIIRKYVLKDSLGMNASEGVIWLYDPEGEMVHDWNIAEQECITHNACDGLHATADGLEHALRIRVPISEMEYAGTYRFVLHIKDDHSGLYRNGVDRWSLDLNCHNRVHSFTVWCRSTLPEAPLYGADVASRLHRVGDWRSEAGVYAPYWPPGGPETGGTGLMTDKQPRHTIHTLNMWVGPADRRYRRWSAVWMYAGHGDFEGGTSYTYLNFDNLPNEDSGIYVATECTADQRFMIAGHDLSHIRLAYLMACYSAGANGGIRCGIPVYIPENRSIGYHFAEYGARAVVGFSNLLFALEPCKAFHDVFWTEVCKGILVGTAYKDAKAKCDQANGRVKQRTYRVFPVLFGNPSIKIVPPKYGFE